METIGGEIGVRFAQNEKEGHCARDGFGGCLDATMAVRTLSVAFNKMSRNRLKIRRARFNKGGRLEDEFIRDRHYITFRKAARSRAR